MININIKEKFFKDIKILENIKISVREGEFLSIIGPSGCGKTTLLNIASSLDKDFNGKVTISSSNIGFVFQDFDITSIFAYSFAFIFIVILIENIFLNPLEKRMRRGR